jgi:RNA polymerase sigma factor (sigma-70 family)
MVDGVSDGAASGDGAGRGEAVGGQAVGGGGLDEAVAVFLAVRPRLMAVAYRILGGGSEVEDVVQEIWVRWQRMDRREVANPQAMLVTMTARVAINVTCSARRRRETTVANWPPEQADPSEDPASRIEEQEAVEQAVQLLMERLTPRERAALILREAFDYPYVQLSEFLQLRAANTRQLVSRARRRLAGEYHTAAPRPSHPEPHPHFTQALLRAARTGDLRDVEQLLADNSPADRPGPWRRRVGRHSHAELARPQTGVHSNRITHQTWAMASTERVTIEAVLRSVCGRRPERLVPLTGGGMNETCRAELEGGSTVVVRIARHPAPWFVDESYLMAQARDAGVPTPEVLGVEHHEDDGEVLSFSVQEYVPGRSLAELVGEINRTELERVVTDAGEILARVHSVMPAAGRGHQHVLRVPDDQEVLRVARIVDARGGAVPADLVVRAADFLRQELTDQAAPPPSLVHGDFCPKNILVHRGNVVGLIDWEFAGLAPAAYDFAQWEVDAGEPLQDRLDLVRRGYARIADPDVGAGWTAVFATAWALEKLGWKNPAGPAQFQRCLDVIGRAIVR